MCSLEEAGKELARWRKELGLTLRQAGDRAGVNYQRIQQLEKHPVRPSLELACALAKAYGRTPTDVAVLFCCWEPGTESVKLTDIIAIGKTMDEGSLDRLWRRMNEFRLGIVGSV